MKRYLTGLVAALAALATVTAPAAAGGVHRPSADDGDVTMTIGLLQDMSSPNVTVGYLVPEFEVWNLQYATLTDKAADDFANDPRTRRVVGGIRRRADLHLHAARGSAVVGRRAAHGRRHRLHDQPVARRGVDQPLLDGAEPRGHGARRAHRGDRQRRCRTRSCRRWTCTSCPSTSTSRSRPTTSPPTTPSTASRRGSTR